MEISILLSIKWYDLFLLIYSVQGTCTMIRRTQLALVVGILGISLLACTPIITIGYGEILIMILVLVLVVGPVFYRFFRTRSNSDQENGDQGQD